MLLLLFMLDAMLVVALFLGFVVLIVVVFMLPLCYSLCCVANATADYNRRAICSTVVQH